jgi:prepilin-type N-terminal cleavage/methylation domain-containing protein
MKKNHRQAFTLIELIVTVAIVAIISVVVFTNLRGGNSQADLNSATTEIVASLREAQSQAMSGNEDATWGVYFQNGSGTPSFFAVISSSTYNTSTIISQYPLPPDIAFVTSSLSQGSSLTVSFQPIGGGSFASTTKTIAVYLTSEPSLQEYISVTDEGQVSYGTACNGAIQEWQTTAALPTTVNTGGAVTADGYVYLIGGYYGVFPSSTVSYAQVNSSTGALGPWSTAGTLPTALRYTTAVTSNGYIYDLGGYNNSSVFITSTYYAQVNSSTGLTGAWATSTTPLPVASGWAENYPAVASNGYIYWAVGQDTATSTIYYTQVNSSTGALNPWSTTTMLPITTSDDYLVANNGYIYALGAFGTSTIYYAQVNTNTGALGPWLTTGAAPIQPFGPDTGAQPVVNNGILYLIGGYYNGIGSSTVYYAPFNSNATLGSWSVASTLLVPFGSQQIVYPDLVSNGDVYMIAPQLGSTATSAVYYAPLCP